MSPMNPRLLRPTARGGFNPLRLANLSVWYDAADASTVTLNGSAVSEWKDKSGNGIHAAQSTANNQPAYVTGARNGLPVVSFDGMDDSLVTASFANGWSAFTSFAVFSSIANQPPSGGFGILILWTRSTDRQRAILLNAGLSNFSVRGHLNSNAAFDYETSSFGAYSTYYYMTHRHDGTTTSRPVAFTGRSNGADVANTQTGSFSVSSVANTVLRIGNRSDGTRGFYGNVGEILVYSSALSAAEVASVEAYLARKWGF